MTLTQSYEASSNPPLPSCRPKLPLWGRLPPLNLDNTLSSPPRISDGNTNKNINVPPIHLPDRVGSTRILLLDTQACVQKFSTRMDNLGACIEQALKEMQLARTSFDTVCEKSSLEIADTIQKCEATLSTKLNRLFEAHNSISNKTEERLEHLTALYGTHTSAINSLSQSVHEQATYLSTLQTQLASASGAQQTALTTVQAQNSTTATTLAAMEASFRTMHSFVETFLSQIISKVDEALERTVKHCLDTVIEDKITDLMSRRGSAINFGFTSDNLDIRNAMANGASVGANTQSEVSSPLILPFRTRVERNISSMNTCPKPCEPTPSPSLLHNCSTTGRDEIEVQVKKGKRRRIMLGENTRMGEVRYNHEHAQTGMGIEVDNAGGTTDNCSEVFRRVTRSMSAAKFLPTPSKKEKTSAPSVLRNTGRKEQAKTKAYRENTHSKAICTGTGTIPTVFEASTINSGIVPITTISEILAIGKGDNSLSGITPASTELKEELNSDRIVTENCDGLLKSMSETITSNEGYNLSSHKALEHLERDVDYLQGDCSSSMTNDIKECESYSSVLSGASNTNKAHHSKPDSHYFGSVIGSAKRKRLLVLEDDSGFEEEHEI